MDWEKLLAYITGSHAPDPGHRDRARAQWFSGSCCPVSPCGWPLVWRDARDGFDSGSGVLGQELFVGLDVTTALAPELLRGLSR